MKKALFSLGLGIPVLGFIMASLISAVAFVGRPFPGFLVFPNLLVSPLNLPWWLPPQDGALYPWVLDSLDTVQLRSGEDFDASLASLSPGEIHQFTFRKGGARMVKVFPVTTFRSVDFLVVCGPLFLSGTIITLIGILAGMTLPAGPTSLALLFSCLALGGWMGTQPDWMVSHRIPYVLLFFVSMTTSTAGSYPFLFPFPWAQVHGRLGFVFPLCLAAGVSLLALFTAALPFPERYVHIDTLNAGLLVLCWALYGLRLVGAARSSLDRDWKVARIALLGGVVPFGFIMVPFVIFLYFFHTPYSLLTFTMPLGILLPASLAWGLYSASHH